MTANTGVAAKPTTSEQKDSNPGNRTQKPDGKTEKAQYCE